VTIKNLIGVLLLAATLWSPRAFCTDSLDALIQHADQIRSSKPAEFTVILGRLNAAASSATPQQQQYIRYLNAYALAFLGKLDDSIRLARPLLQPGTSPDLQFRVGALIVNNYALNGRYNEGLRQLDRTIALVDRVRDPALREHGLIAATALYNQIGQYQLAKRYAEMVLASPSSGRAFCFANYYKFDALQKMKQLPEADDSLLSGIAVCEKEHEAAMASLLRTTLARKWIENGQRDRAIAYLQQHLGEMMATRYPRSIAEGRSLLASLQFDKGDLAGAEVNARSTLEQSNVLTTPPAVSALFTLYQIADKRGEPVTALAAYKRFSEAERAYLEEVKAKELAYHLVREEARQKNQQIELLNRRNNLLQLQQQVDQQSAQNSRLYMLLFALLAATIGYWAYKTKRMQMSVKHMAETDALTGICNRHHYTAQAEKTLARCKAAGEPVSLLMFDLDYFKSINDNYGHVTGDWVLKRVAQVCTGMCRGIDHLGRIGGEEFAILLHGCDLKAATRMAEDCRVRLSRIDPLPSGYTFPISASFGVSSSTTSGYDLDKLLSHADQMLYRAKREGRNRVRAYMPETSAELTGVNFRKDSGLTASLVELPSQDSLRA
jgi:diguanylate cyclase (GGDEF)-like protein